MTSDVWRGLPKKLNGYQPAPKSLANVSQQSYKPTMILQLWWTKTAQVITHYMYLTEWWYAHCVSTIKFIKIFFYSYLFVLSTSTYLREPPYSIARLFSPKFTIYFLIWQKNQCAQFRVAPILNHKENWLTFAAS